MIRAAILFLLLAGSVAAADELPVPPRPPGRIPTPDLAPVPDPDARTFADQSTDGTNVQIRFFRSDVQDPGAGFTPGSRFQTPEERKPIQTPGLSVSVPLQ